MKKNNLEIQFSAM